MGRLFASWCLLSLLYCCPWHSRCSLSDAAGSKLLSCSAPSPPRVLLGRGSSLEHPRHRTIVEWENFLKCWKKDLQDRKLISFAVLVSAHQHLPVWSGFLSSGVEPDLQPYSPGSGWFSVLSEKVGLILLGSWCMWSLTMWWCWEIINAPSEPQVELVVSINAQKSPIFQIVSWLVYGLYAAWCLACLTVHRITGILCPTASGHQNSCSPPV